MLGGGNPAPAAAETGGTGLWQQATRAFVGMQRQVNRALTNSVAELRDGRSSAAILVGIAIAFLYGVFHAAGPGHGKAVVISYFVSRPATMRRCIVMGVQIALFHVVSAVVIVSVLHWVLQRSFSTPVDQMQFLKIASYAAITAIGVVMLVAALRQRSSAEASHGACAHGQDHGSHHGHGAGGLLSLAVGVIPCSGAVIILVFSLANGILLSGLVMTGFIALGMAITLAVIAMTAAFARGRIVGPGNKVSSPRRQRLRRTLEILGPAAIAGFGGLLLLAALSA
ncbi:MAG: nickel/cobalt transporter [Dongiaceae bacterium]